MWRRSLLLHMPRYHTERDCSCWRIVFKVNRTLFIGKHYTHTNTQSILDYAVIEVTYVKWFRPIFTLFYRLHAYVSLVACVIALRTVYREKCVSDCRGTVLLTSFLISKRIDCHKWWHDVGPSYLTWNCRCSRIQNCSGLIPFLFMRVLFVWSWIYNV